MFAALRKLLTGWFGPPAEKQADANAPEAENVEILRSTAKIHEIRPEIDKPTPSHAVPYDENLLERAQSTELKPPAYKPAKDEASYERGFWASSAPGCAESSSARA